MACVEKLLPALDSIDIARSQSEDKGLAMIQKQLLDGTGLSILDPLGEVFDPNLHEPMGTVEAKDAEEDTIVTVLQKGYKFKEVIIRPAKVQVATSNK
jgi:molecular chaperone GrpE